MSPFRSCERNRKGSEYQFGGGLCVLADGDSGKPNRLEDGTIISGGGPIGCEEILIGMWAVQICFNIDFRGCLILPMGFPAF